MKAALLSVVTLALGCRGVDDNSPEAAFAGLAPCIDTADAECLFGVLDRDSRWSLQTIHRGLTDAKAQVQRSYPPEAKIDAFGTWKPEATAKDPKGVLREWCTKNQCLTRIARTFGAVIQKRETGKDRVVLKTTRGGTFEMLYAEKRWGITLFRDALQDAKLRIQDRVKQVELNAAQFEEQRSAGTIGDRNTHGKKEP